MKHAYLTHTSVQKALENGAITKKEAQRLEKCIECQEKIARVVKHH